MSLSDNLDEMIALYVVSKLSLRTIGDRLGVTHEAVRLRLLAAGVVLRGRGADTVERARPKPRAAPVVVPDWHEPMTGPAPPPIPPESADLRHCLAVIRALGGRGFPFCDVQRGAA